MEKPNFYEQETSFDGAEVVPTSQAELRSLRAEFYRNRPGMGKSGLPEVVIEQIVETEPAQEEGE